MTRALLMMLLAICLVALAAGASPETTTQADQVAHGAEKQAHKIAHPTEDHGAGHAAPRTYLGIPAWIWKTVNMIVFIAVLYFLVKGPVGAMFRGRAEAIRNELAQAAERRTKADQLASDIQARLSQIQGEVAAILTRAEEEGKRQKQELTLAAEVEAAKMLQSARNEIDARLKQARRELTEYAGELAAKRAEEILATSLTAADQKKIFSDGVAQLTENRG